MSRHFCLFWRLAGGLVILTASANVALAASESGTLPRESMGTAFIEPMKMGDHSQPAAVLAPDPDDPYEQDNRGRFKFHVALHRDVIDPVEVVYLGIVPKPLRKGLHNFFLNLDTPKLLANNLFQGQLARAADTFSRFAINSTIGIGGIFDVASRIGVPYRDDDFGRTLAVYGMGDYPYLMVPVIGSSNPRDLTGLVVDFFLNPLHYIALPGGIATSAGYAGLNEVDSRSDDAGALVELNRTVPDPYAAERHMSRDRRDRELSDIRDPQ